MLGCPRTCLHAILNILEKGTEGRTGPVAVRESPQLAELCYQVYRRLHFVTLNRRNLTRDFNRPQIRKYNKTELKWVHFVIWPVSLIDKIHKAQTPRSYRSTDPICWSPKKWGKLDFCDEFRPDNVETFQWCCVSSCFFLVERVVNLGQKTSGSFLCPLTS